MAVVVFMSPSWKSYYENITSYHHCQSATLYQPLSGKPWSDVLNVLQAAVLLVLQVLLVPQQLPAHRLRRATKQHSFLKPTLLTRCGLALNN